MCKHERNVANRGEGAKVKHFTTRHISEYKHFPPLITVIQTVGLKGKPNKKPINTKKM